MPAAAAVPVSTVKWTRKHLLGLEELSADEITLILDQAEEFKRLAAQGETKLKALSGTVVANLFFENSTRTKTSFNLAAKRLSADTIDFSSSGSSLSKGETFIDTARNIEAMGANQVVVRHSTPGAPLLLSQHVNASILNAGDGTHEHPTQGLLDVFSIRERVGHVKGVIVCGPATLIPPHIERLGVEVAHNFDSILPRCDCVNLLRIQFERQRSGLFPSITEYSHLFGMNGDRLKKSKSDIVILAPGPINRGVEITPDVADGRNSVILDQVTNGLFIRMACLYLLHQQQSPTAA